MTVTNKIKIVVVWTITISIVVATVLSAGMCTVEVIRTFGFSRGTFGTTIFTLAAYVIITKVAVLSTYSAGDQIIKKYVTEKEGTQDTRTPESN